MRIHALKIVVALFVLMGSSISYASAGTDLKKAEAYVQSLGDEALSLLRENGSAKEKRDIGIREMLATNLALDRIGRIIYGRGWREASDDERSEYQSLVNEYILAKYTYLIAGYNGQTFKVMGSQPAGKDDALVTTAILKDGQTAATVDWRITENNSALAILDVKIEKSSMVQTEKSQFQSVLGKDGHAGLVKALQQQIERIKNNTE